MMGEQPFHGRQGEPGGRTDSVWKRLWNVISYQWQWKLLCLLLAVCLWGIVISQNTTLTREKIIQGVTVNQNAETLRQKGLIVVGGLEELETVTVKAEVPIRYYNTVNSSSFKVSLDFSEVTGPGEQDVRLVAASSIYGTVKEISIPNVLLTVERYITKGNIPVRIDQMGETPEGYYAKSARAEVSDVSVAGPASVVNSIARCIVHYTVPAWDGGFGTERTASPIEFYDRSNSPVSNRYLTVTADGLGVEISTVTVQQTFYPAARLSLSDAGLVQGKPAEGYEVKNVRFSVDSIIVAAEDLSMLTENTAFLTGTVDITGLSADYTAVLDVMRPSSYVYVSTDKVAVTVEIGPEEGGK